MSNILFKPLPSIPTWAKRLIAYPILLIALSAVFNNYNRIMLQRYFVDCSYGAHFPRGSSRIERNQAVMACIDQKASFYQRWLLKDAITMLAALPSVPCRYVGTWLGERANITTSISLRGDGSYSGRVISGRDKGFPFSGEWGVHDNKMVWLDDQRIGWPLDINEIIDEGIKGFALIELDGSHTQYSLKGLPQQGACVASVENTEPEKAIAQAANTDNIMADTSETYTVAKYTDIEKDIVRISSTLLADPLPLSLNETLFLYEKSPYAEKMNWSNGETEKIVLPFLLKNPQGDAHKHLKRYAIAANKAGLWFAGPVLALREPDGIIHVMESEYREPYVIGLDDGSLLLFAKSDKPGVFNIFRSRLTPAKQIELEPLKGTHDLYDGFAAVKLQDGRVLLVGGLYGQGKARLYNPADNSWQDAGDLHAANSYMAMTALPDGRAVVMSSGSLAYAKDPERAVPGQISGGEIWDPKSLSWSPLPELPLSYLIMVDQAERPSIAALPDGSLVMAGGMHRHVLLLRAKDGVYAPYWTVAGSLPMQRIGGVVQALGNQEVVVSGGVGPMDERGGCCRYQPGGDSIAWSGDGKEYQSSISLSRRDAAVAYGDDLSFAAGGWESFDMLTQTTQPSALAELIDQRSGKVSLLPPLPKPLLAGNAIWLDADRVLVKSVSTDVKRDLQENIDGYIAIYDRRQNSWRLFEDTRIERAELVGMLKQEAILLNPGIKTWKLDVNSNSLKELPQRSLLRGQIVWSGDREEYQSSISLSRRDAAVAYGGVARVLNDGTIVVAGGVAQTDILQALDPGCRQDDCPMHAFGRGALTPSRYYEFLEPGGTEWRISVPSTVPGESAVIRGDGRVIKLGNDSKQWMIVSSNSDGSAWQELPWPDGLASSMSSDDKSCGYRDIYRSCVLLQGQLHDSDVIFLLNSYWAIDVMDFRFDLRVLSKDEKQWLLVSDNLSYAELFSVHDLPLQIGERSLRGSRFFPHSVHLWQE